MKIENSLIFRLHKIGTLYVCSDERTDGWTNGMEWLLDLLSPSATQVIKQSIDIIKFHEEYVDLIIISFQVSSKREILLEISQ